MVTKQERKLLIKKYYLRYMEPLAILRQLRDYHNIKCSKNTVYRDIEEAKIFMKQNLANELSSILTFQIHTRHELLGELWALFGSTNHAMHKVAVAKSIMKCWDGLERLVGLDRGGLALEDKEMKEKDTPLPHEILAQYINSLPAKLRDEVLAYERSQSTRYKDKSA